MVLNSWKNGTFQEQLAVEGKPSRFLKNRCMLGLLHGRGKVVVYDRLAGILFFSLAGCQTTEFAPAWWNISHQKSNLTIISDYFDVDILRKKEGFESISEVANLSIAGRRVEFISRQETLGESSGYCSYTFETFWNLPDARKNRFQAILTPWGPTKDAFLLVN